MAATTAGLLIISAVLLGSATVWAWIVVQYLSGEHPFPFRERSRVSGIDLADQHAPRWNPLVPLLVAAFVGWQILNLVMTAGQDDQPAPSLEGIQLQAGIYAAIVFVLLFLMPMRGARLRDFGVRGDDCTRQSRDGMLGFLASMIPVFAVLWLTFPLRSLEDQHPLFRSIQEHPDPTLIIWVTLLAAVVAPLAEELMFRVVLQGWLENYLTPGLAIGLVAIIFSAVHGWPDAVPLFPLALVLGYIYYRRHSYWAVVVLHALFNGFMLLTALLMQSGG